MDYDKALLKSWAETETWEEYLERVGAFNDKVSREGFRYLESRYFKEIQKRIDYCKALLIEHDDSCIYYTLAELYDRGNLDESVEQLYKRQVRYYCIKAIRKDDTYAPAWELLSEAYIWIAAIDGESCEMPMMETAINDQDIQICINRKVSKRHKSALFFIECAIKAMKKAVSLDPGNRVYLSKLKEFYSIKSDEINCENKY